MTEDTALTSVNRRFGNGYPVLESKEWNGTAVARGQRIISRQRTAPGPAWLWLQPQRDSSPRSPLSQTIWSTPCRPSPSEVKAEQLLQKPRIFFFFFGAQAVLNPCTNTNQSEVRNWHVSSSPVSKRAETHPSISFCHKDSWPRRKINRKDEIWYSKISWMKAWSC